MRPEKDSVEMIDRQRRTRVLEFDRVIHTSFGLR